MNTIKQNRNITIGYYVLVFLEGAQGGEKTPGAESAAAVECPEVPARPHSTGGSGRVLTEAVLQTQRDTINAITVIADELKQIRVVLCDIASTLKDLVKK